MREFEFNPTQAIFIQNDSGETIPPFSVVMVTGMEVTAGDEFNEPQTIRHVTKYDGSLGNILVTGKSPIIPGSEEEIDEDELPEGWWNPVKAYGTAYSDQRLYVAIDQTTTYPTPGEEWGPIEGEWFIGRGGSGFIADGVLPDDDASDSGSGSDPMENIDETRAIFYRSGSVAPSTTNVTCVCDPLDCPSETGATVVDVAEAPNGAFEVYTLFSGPTDYSDASGTSPFTTFTYGDDQWWYSEENILIDDSSGSGGDEGIYQMKMRFVLDFFNQSVYQIFIVFVSGTDWKGIGT